MRSLGMLALALLLTAYPVASAELSALLPGKGEPPACWQRIYSEAHLAEHRAQRVMAMTFGAGFHVGEETVRAEDGVTLFAMSVTLRDGTTGHTSGQCWQDDAGALRCNVECDGGGVVVRDGRTGGLLLDLGRTGYIRMEGECGGDGESDGFDLKPGADDRQFLLHPVNAKLCKSLLPD